MERRPRVVGPDKFYGNPALTAAVLAPRAENNMARLPVLLRFVKFVKPFEKIPIMRPFAMERQA
ncbi:hypothetical protein [Bradyrhizobium sp. LMG 9283]|uniref:hypothetical protein n=1 Tax=Bradyrhizobium sp. LMG 9283 TaxID=592064 RepID=UPI00388D5CB5